MKKGRPLSLRQVRALADPLRMRVLECLTEEVLTTKQVADRLRLPPTRLYHHVGVLEKAGLIQLVRTQRKRGTIEKYYKAVMGNIVVDRRVKGVLTGALQATLSEVDRLRRTEDAVVYRIKVRTSAAGLDELQRVLTRWAKKTGKGDKEYSITFAAYPTKGGKR